MRLVNKKKTVLNNIEYLIDVDKIFYGNVGGDDHYIYKTYIYNINKVKEKHWLKRLFFKYIYKYECIYKYSTYWLNYFDYGGDIDKVIQESFKKYEWNLREQKYISEKERS